MNSANKKLKRRRLLLGILILAALFLLFASGKRGFLQQIRVHQKKRQLEREIQSLEAVRDTLQTEKKELNDPANIEKIARENYGMAKEKEKVYRVVPAEKK